MKGRPPCLLRIRSAARNWSATWIHSAQNSEQRPILLLWGLFARSGSGIELREQRDPLVRDTDDQESAPGLDDVDLPASAKVDVLP